MYTTVPVLDFLGCNIRIYLKWAQWAEKKWIYWLMKLESPDMQLCQLDLEGLLATVASFTIRASFSLIGHTGFLYVANSNVHRQPKVTNL